MNKKMCSFIYKIAVDCSTDILYSLKSMIYTVNSKKKDLYGRSLFYWANATGQGPLVITRLFNEGHDPQEKYFYLKYGSTPICIAIKTGQLDVLKLLLNKLSSEEQGDAIANSLYLAVLFGHDEIVKYLIVDREVEPNPSFFSKKPNPLALACERNDIEIVKSICTTKKPLVVSINHLKNAVSNDHLAVVQFLVEKYPHLLQETTKGGDTLLGYAIQFTGYNLYLMSEKSFKQNKIVELVTPILIQCIGQDGKKNYKVWGSKDGIKTELTNVMFSDQELKKIQEMSFNRDCYTFINHRSVLFAPLKQGHLHLINGQDNDLIIEYLIDKVKGQDFKNKTIQDTVLPEKSNILHLAVMKGQIELIYLLAEKCLDLVKQADALGRTPIKLAREIKRNDIADFLEKAMLAYTNTRMFASSCSSEEKPTVPRPH